MAQIIDTSEWHEFRIGDLFDVLLSSDDLQAKKMNEGPIPLVSSGSVNNGVCAYVEELEGVKTFPSGTITVDMFGKAFYQPNDYYAVSHGRVNMLLAERPLRDEHGLFLQSVLDATIGHKYSYAYMCTSSKLIDEVINLPAVAPPIGRNFRRFCPEVSI